MNLIINIRTYRVIAYLYYKNNLELLCESIIWIDINQLIISQRQQQQRAAAQAAQHVSKQPSPPEVLLPYA